MCSHSCTGLRNYAELSKYRSCSRLMRKYPNVFDRETVLLVPLLSNSVSYPECQRHYNLLTSVIYGKTYEYKSTCFLFSVAEEEVIKIHVYGSGEKGLHHNATYHSLAFHFDLGLFYNSVTHVYDNLILVLCFLTVIQKV